MAYAWRAPWRGKRKAWGVGKPTLVLPRWYLDRQSQSRHARAAVEVGKISNREGDATIRMAAACQHALREMRGRDMGRAEPHAQL